MSYDSIPSKIFKIGASGRRTDEKREPLIGGDTTSVDYKQFCQKLDDKLKFLSTSIVSLNSKIREYTRQVQQNKLTQESDQAQVFSIGEKINHIKGLIQKARDDLHALERIEVPAGQVNEKQKQQTSLSSKHQQLAEQFHATLERFSKSVQQQQQKTQEKAAQTQQLEDEERQLKVTQNDQQQVQLLEQQTKEQLRDQAKVHQLADLIQDRNETISNLAQVMNDVKQMTDDIRGQTRQQGEQLDEVDENVGDAADHIEQANEELEGVMEKERDGNKCLSWCVGITIVCIVILIVVKFVHKDAVVMVEFEPQDAIEGAVEADQVAEQLETAMSQ